MRELPGVKTGMGCRNISKARLRCRQAKSHEPSPNRQGRRKAGGHEVEGN